MDAPVGVVRGLVETGVLAEIEGDRLRGKTERLKN
jgi:hypothetical protein